MAEAENPIKESVLENGVRVVTINDDNARGVCQLFYFIRGNEHEGERGSMHFIEHLLFRTAAMQHKITSKIRNICPKDAWSATTTPYGVYFSILTLPKAVEAAFDYLKLMAFPDRLLTEAVSFEKGRFRNELDTHIFSSKTRSGRFQRWRITNLFSNSLWLQSMLGGGDRQSVDTLSLEELDAIRKRNFCGANLVYFAVGKNINHSEVVARAETALSQIEKGVPSVVAEEGTFIPFTAVVPRLPLVKPMVELIFGGPPKYTDESAKMFVLSAMLDEFDSPLASLIMGRHGKYHNTGVSLERYKKFSFIKLTFSGGHDELGSMFNDALDLLKNRDQWLTQELFENMRQRVLTDISFSSMAEPRSINHSAVAMAESYIIGEEPLMKKRMEAVLERLSFEEFREFVDRTLSSAPTYIVHKPMRMKGSELPDYDALAEKLGITANLKSVRRLSYAAEFIGTEYKLAKDGLRLRSKRVFSRLKHPIPSQNGRSLE